jgi:coenzyme F420-reducing hydrogenase alpha subunit
MNTSNIKDKLDQAIKTANNTIETVKDSVSEKLHEGAAKAEATRRETEGDVMTPAEKLASVANQAKNSVQAGIDHAKVEARKET